MGLFSGNKNLSLNLTLEDGIPSIQNGSLVKVTARDEESKLEITLPFVKNSVTVNLPYSQITACVRIADTQIIEIQKNKSSIGRAIGGGLLLGPLGATVGAISGVGTKTKTKKEYSFYIVINYTSSDGESKVVSFKEPTGMAGLTDTKFLKHIKEVANIKDIELPTEITL